MFRLVLLRLRERLMSASEICLGPKFEEGAYLSDEKTLYQMIGRVPNSSYPSREWALEDCSTLRICYKASHEVRGLKLVRESAHTEPPILVKETQ